MTSQQYATEVLRIWQAGRDMGLRPSERLRVLPSFNDNEPSDWHDLSPLDTLNSLAPGA